MQFAVVDLETTGGSAMHDRIVEIGIVWFEDGHIIREYRQLLNPERHIPWNVSQIHGITDSMVENEPTFQEVAEEIFDLTSGRIFVAHNVQFDYGFLRESFRRAGMEFERRRICTVRFSKKLNPSQRKHSLKTLCQVYGIENERAHRALEDAKATALVLGNLLQQEGSEAILKQLLSGKGGINLLPPNLSYHKIENLPETPGVYLFYDSQGKVLYVGKAVNIRDRVRQHFSGHTHTGMKRSFLDSIHDLSIVETGHELMALLTENELIKKHYPRYNSTQKDFQLTYGIFSFFDQHGYLRLVAGPSGKWTQPLRVYRAKEEAMQALLKLTMQFGLCLQLNQILHEESGKCAYQSDTNTVCLRCNQAADPETYNQNAHQACQHLKGNDFFLRFQGREVWEFGVVWVEKGKIKGTGFVPESDFGDKESILRHLQSYYDTQDAQSILRLWLEKAHLSSELKDGIPLYEFDEATNPESTIKPTLLPQY